MPMQHPNAFYKHSCPYAIEKVRYAINASSSLIDHFCNLNMGEGAILMNSMAEEINQENSIDDQSNPGVGCTTLGRKMPKAIQLTH